MAKKSPLQEMKERFGSKEEVVKLLVDRLHKHEDESKEEFTKRLLRVSNKKLLKLYETTEAVYEKFGTKMDLVDKILKLERPNASKVDEPFKESLLRKSHGYLLDRYRGLVRRAKRAGKSA